MEIERSEIAPSLPVFGGAADEDLRPLDQPRRRSEHTDAAADMVRAAGARNLSEYTMRAPNDHVQHLKLNDQVLLYNPDASLHCHTPGPIIGRQEPGSSTVPDKGPNEPIVPITRKYQRDYGATLNDQFNSIPPYDTSMPCRKPKAKRKASDGANCFVGPDSIASQESTIECFCELVEDICSRVEIVSDDRDEAEWLSMPLSDLRILSTEIISLHTMRLLHLVPVDIIFRLLRISDHHIHGAGGLSMTECAQSDSNGASSINCALESIHAALGVMAHNQMPKQLYKEEIIEKLLEFSRHQILDVMCACDPTYSTLHMTSENGTLEVDEDQIPGAETGSASKRRRSTEAVKVQRSSFNRDSAAVNNILQKMCTILGLLKDLLLIEKLSDSCILQLLKTSFSTFMVDNIQLLQMKAIGLISGIFYSYSQHRTYVIDELLQLLWKLPFSNGALRTYPVPDEEQTQIQMITVLLIQLIHCSSNPPITLRQESSINSILEVSLNADQSTKGLESAQAACAHFWKGVLECLARMKNQEASEFKVVVENLVTDLLTTLNLPEYPASASILEVLCVLLLANAGVNSRDASARTMAIDLLGTIAARLKSDSVLHRRGKFLILQELVSGNGDDQTYPKDVCSACFDCKVEKSFFVCQGCQRMFHVDCVGLREHEVTNLTWQCQICLCRKQLVVLQSYCKSQCKDDGVKDHKSSGNNAEVTSSVTNFEVVQQLILNYLQDNASADDVHLFVRWFYVCSWNKDDPPKSQQKFMYDLARLNSRAIVRDSGTVSSLFTSDLIKQFTFILGQSTSFARGFDKILHLLLACLSDDSPVIRANALCAVSIVVEADPEVLGDKLVQLAVEGRFCDSAISVREAALELVGRHIASHPDVGLKYFEKVAERIADTGVSVRKRSIKIIRDMCVSNGDFCEFTSACIAIISRIGDDESSIQDLVCKTFYEFWFVEPTGSQIQFFGDGSSVPLEAAKKTEQIVEMLGRMPNPLHLVTVIKRNLSLDFFPHSSKAVGIDPVLLASVRKRCELMCMFLLERILQVEETNIQEVEMRAFPYVQVLQAFYVVDPSLCASVSDSSLFMVTLQPFLKTQVRDECRGTTNIAVILPHDIVLGLDTKDTAFKDSKATNLVVKKTENNKKYRYITEKIIATSAGSKDLAERTWAQMERHVSEQGEQHVTVESLAEIAAKMPTTTEDNERQASCELFIAGFENNEPVVWLACNVYDDDLQKRLPPAWNRITRTISAIGSGREDAMGFLTTDVMPSLEEAIGLVQRALLNSAMHDSYTGGLLQVIHMGRDKIKIENDYTVLQLIKQHYSFFENGADRSVFIFYQLPWGYNNEDNIFDTFSIFGKIDKFGHPLTKLDDGYGMQCVVYERAEDVQKLHRATKNVSRSHMPRFMKKKEYLKSIQVKVGSRIIFVGKYSLNLLECLLSDEPPLPKEKPPTKDADLPPTKNADVPE